MGCGATLQAGRWDMGGWRMGYGSLEDMGGWRKGRLEIGVVDSTGPARGLEIGNTQAGRWDGRLKEGIWEPGRWGRWRMGYGSLDYS